MWVWHCSSRERGVLVLRGTLHFDLGHPTLQIYLHLSLPKCEARAGECLLASCLQRKPHPRVEMWGFPYGSHHLQSKTLSGDRHSDCTTTIWSVICIFKNMLSHWVRCWEVYGDSLSGGQSPWPGSLLCAGVGTCSLGPGRFLQDMEL